MFCSMTRSDSHYVHESNRIGVVDMYISVFAHGLAAYGLLSFLHPHMHGFSKPLLS
jgi:hypothetical protein